MLAVNFVELLFACCQMSVFSIENSYHSSGFCPGGSNKEIYDKYGRFVGVTPNPIPDFVTYKR